MSDDRHWMSRAITEAEEALGSTAPNPAVGAVLVRNGLLLGMGHTQPPGGYHAEAVALADAKARGIDVSGATIYITLEPCRHYGRTPPCTDAIIAAGISRVVVGVEDVFPAMQGKALKQLRQAGLEVVLGVEGDRCANLVRGFTRATAYGLPEVTCKAGISADGHIATQSGESQWITGEAARQKGHRLRATHDAVAVGIGTVLADNPRLTCRHGGSHPRPVVFDTELRIPDSAAIFDHPSEPILLCARDAPQRELRADIVRLPRGAGGVDVEQALRALVCLEQHRILIEGGGQLHRSLLDARLVDTVCLFMAGMLIPGGRPWVGGSPLDSLAQAIKLKNPIMERVGPDIQLLWQMTHAVDESEESCSQD
ncbi:MAG: bifunctional diaminohydroxyphosphoribosylaminopyrimidine deaminase/5-amino-6-(5-phosphoribosylamino)uracil reductase RibD [Proteobacteria bacterium]|nr:bifunctional diaminohydroxyphosphoribosylaminopyrimidine deaminase/5-amino-6-(5-phosphoribosylamino)uracil reductase RibD [Pseudomonadota bacterium]